MTEIVNIISELVNTLGVPVAMLVYFIYDKTTTTNKLTNAIENNNAVLDKILEHFRIEDTENE